MISIVGTRIYMYENDDCSFKIMYKNSEGDINNFNPEDILTMIIRDRDTKDVLLSKIAKSIEYNDEVISVFTFDATDYKIVCKGDYKYDILFESSTGSTHTLIDNAWLNILKCIRIPNPLGNEFNPHRLEDNNAIKRICLSRTPLICNFDYIQVDNTETPSGSLIVFDNVLNKIDEDSEETDDDTLILFSTKEENPKNEEDTLIVF